MKKTALSKPGFTARQLELQQYMLQGLISKEIAGKMQISKHTVDTHRRNIRKILRLNNDMNSGEQYKIFGEIKNTHK